ncbi:hypothetical protein HDU93_006062, partial [Gonapodya sp. JEL0774]
MARFGEDGGATAARVPVSGIADAATVTELDVVDTVLGTTRKGLSRNVVATETVDTGDRADAADMTAFV